MLKRMEGEMNLREKEDTSNTREMRQGKGRGDSRRQKGREIRESEDHEGKRDVGKTEWIETQ